MGRCWPSIFALLGVAALAATPCSAVLFPYKTISIGSTAEGVAIGDLNGDGRADVAVATGAAGDPTSDRSVFVFFQKAGGGLAPAVRYADGVEARGIAIGDLNGDGRADLAVCGNNGVAVLRQNVFHTLDAPRFITTGAGADSVAIGDLNGDGRLDLAVSHSDEPQISVLYQTPTGELAAPNRFSVPESGYNEIAVGDLTGDGWADLVFMRGRAGRSTLSVMPQNPVTHRLSAPYRYGWGESRASHGMALADLNGDHHLDVAVTWGGNEPDCGLGIFHQSGGLLTPAVPYGATDGPEAIKAADMNHDGLADLVVVHGGWQSLSTYYQQPDGTMGPEVLDPLPYTSHYAPQALALGDLDGDGIPDVAIAGGEVGLVLLFNAGGRDITPPDTALLGKPAAIYGVSTVSFPFVGLDETTPVANLQYRWNLDAGAWTPFRPNSSATLTGLPEGWHDFLVAARDATGNVDPTPASFHFLVDLTPPSGLSLRGVAPYTNANGITVFAVAEDNLADPGDLTFAWRVDGGPWSDFSYATKITLFSLFEGAHTLEAKAADPAGNISAPAALAFVVDRTPPQTRVERISRDPATGAVRATFAGTDNLPAPNQLSFSWRVDGGAWSPFSPGTEATLTGLTGGTHRFEVRARDAAGNIDPTPAAENF